MTSRDPSVGYLLLQRILDRLEELQAMAEQSADALERIAASAECRVSALERLVELAERASDRADAPISRGQKRDPTPTRQERLAQEPSP